MPASPAETLTTLTVLAAELQLPLSLDELLQRVLVRVGQLLDTTRASIRLFDAARVNLFIGARLGQPVHDVHYEMQPGEGLLGWVAKQGRVLRTNDAERDKRFLARSGQREPMGSFLGAPLVYQGATIGVIVAVHVDKDHFSELHEQAMRLIAGLCAPHLEVARLSRLARIDPVTGALRPEALDSVFPEVLGAGEIAQLSVLLADVDGFKLLNQQLGRDTCDEILRAIARALAGTLRVGDAVIRYGGDAFLLVLPGVGLASASRIGERVRSVVAETLAGMVEPPLSGSISIGAAELHVGESRELLIGRAATALDEARRRGGNTVHMAMV
jgi:diguanylate cyclase (GGDEF)-like protein